MKRAWRSKINWISFGVVLLGVVIDPEFQRYAGAILPPEVISKIVSGCGMLLMLLRTCCTNQAIGKDKGPA